MAEGGETRGAGAKIVEVAREEATHLAGYASYLFICFAVVLVFAWARAGAEGPILAAISFAGAKALGVGHFLTMGDKLKAGHVRLDRPWGLRVLIRSVATLGLILVLTLVEEMGHALIAGEPWHAGPAAFAARGTADLLSTLAVTWLLILPLVTVVEAIRHSSWEEVRHVFLGRRDGNGRLLPMGSGGEGR
jgi:hypothetical protein